MLQKKCPSLVGLILTKRLTKRDYIQAKQFYKV